VGASVVDIGPRLAVVLVALAVLATVAGRLSGLGQERPVLVAALRATVQLAVVSSVLLAVVGSLPLSAAFVLLMLIVATTTAAGRVTGTGLRTWRALRRALPVALPIVGGAAPPPRPGGCTTSWSTAGARWRQPWRWACSPGTPSC
jgi:hypothetical protein